MEKILEKLRSNSLLLKILSVMLLSVICVATLTLSISIRASEDVYVDTFTESNSQIIGQIRENMGRFNDEISEIMSVIKNNWAFRSYLTSEDRSSATASYTQYSMVWNLEHALPPDYFEKMSIVLVGVNGSSYLSSDAGLTVSVEELLDSAVTQETRRQPNRILYQYVDDGFTTLTQGDSAIVASTGLNYAGGQSNYGYAYVVIPQEVLRDFYSSFSSDANSLMLLDSEGRIISSTQKELIGFKNLELLETAQQVEENSLPYGEIVQSGRQMAVVAQEIPHWNFHLVGLIDRESILRAVGSYKPIEIMTLLVVLCVFAIMFLVVRKTTRPIHSLVAEMKQVTQGDFSRHIPVEGNYEVRELATAFNYMLDGLDSYMEQIMTIEDEKREAEIRALQMQINPHFIYNTLASLKWMIWQGNSESAVQAIDSFSRLLRGTISKREERIPAAEELDNLKDYVFFQHLRFGEQIQVRFSLAEDCRNCLMPKLTLQPFVENAFFHAFSGAEEGSIFVSVRRRGNDLVSEIIDNGSGMKQEEVGRTLSTGGKADHFTGIGIKNVDDRIKLLYGAQYGVSISSEPGKGTAVTITIPAQEKESKDPTNL